MTSIRSLLVGALLPVAVLTPTRAAVAPLLTAEPSLSPDGARIAFTAGGDIWSVAATGGEAQLLVSHPANDSRPLWSPDGTKLAFISNRTGNGDLYVLELAGGSLTRVTYDDGAEQLDAWSPDGAWLYFSASGRDIAGMNDVYRVRATGGTPMPVLADRYVSEYWAAPSPDGQRLAITARGNTFGQWWRRGHSHLDESELWVATLDATPRYTLVSTEGTRPGRGKDLWPMWSVDGSALFFVSDRNGTENIYRQPLGGSAQPLTQFKDGRVLWPQIARDGKTIVFERDFSLHTLDVATRRVRAVPISFGATPATPLTEHVTITTGIGEPILSPDGRKVVFSARGELFAVGAREGGDAVRLTTNAGVDGMPHWAPDSRRIVYASSRDGHWRLVLLDLVTRRETVLTDGSGDDIRPWFSPDGKSIAYVRDAKELRVLDVATGRARTVATGSLDRVPFVGDREVAWSPDSRWLAFFNAGTKGFNNIYVVPAAGGASPVQVSFAGNSFSGSLVWTPDGRSLFYVSSQRTEEGQVIRVDLVPRTPRFREDQFGELFRSDSGRGGARPDSTRTDSTRARTVVVTPDFTDIRLRSSVLPTNIDVGSVRVSPDGRTLLFVGGAAGQSNLWTWSLDETARDAPVARQLTSTASGKGNAQWSPDSREIWFTENGRLSVIGVESRATRVVAVSAELDVDFATEKGVVVEQACAYLRDNFHDAGMHGADWNTLCSATTARVQASVRTPWELRRVLSLLIGELNASHTGASGPQVTPNYTGRLAARFDRVAAEGGRFVFSEIVPRGPLALAGVKVGERLDAIEGATVTTATNLDDRLSYRTNRRTMLRIVDASGVAREVAVQPISADAEKDLLYRAWVEERRALVARLSGGRLGYVHMFDMGAGSLAQLYLDLDEENHGREGVVVDVRNNNGGFVNAYAIDVFARRGYMSMRPRGAGTAPARSQLGQRALERPTILITNQHSLSDAEDFTEGYRALKLGKVVGEPTSGWIIYTSNVGLIDGTSLRLPFITVFDHEGKDMELVPRKVDVPVTRPVGEGLAGKDSQVEVAVRELLAQLKGAP
ncbi:MAG: hypothetical protein K2X99_11730 [Gemmatimonadaceae bacterium]|nr:hypothetical protein [Gemmatimonadaceae bacterium]